MVETIVVNKPEEYQAAANLFREYAAWLGIDLGFQNFDAELSDLPRMYGLPKAQIILSKLGQEYTGCIAIRPINDRIAELKRMYVRPGVQKSGIATQLLAEAIEFSAKSGYEKIRLDTLSHMIPAMTLYRKFGFKEIAPYYHNPQPTAVFFEKNLLDN